MNRLLFRRGISVILLLVVVGLLGSCDQSSVLTGPELREKSSESPGVIATPAKPTGKAVPNQYIVEFSDQVSQPVDAARELSQEFGIENVRHIYQHAFRGLAGKMSEEVAVHLASSPLVRSIEQDQTVRAVAQTLPTGIDRIEADNNTAANIDNSDDRVDVDVAVLDTGIDLDHPDLNVYKSTDCTGGGPMNSSCTNGEGDDGNGHGSHVAGTVAALDNTEGVVGMAPGARLWAVKVLKDDGSGWMSDIIAGVDWVTGENTDDDGDIIEVANMSLGASGTWSSDLRTAISNSVDEGIYYAVAAGNDGSDIYGGDGSIGDGNEVIPAAYPEVAAVSAMADSDGEPGGNGSDPSYNSDDSFAAEFSNYSEDVVAGNPVSSPGAAIDLLQPGVDIYSTYADGDYRTLSGTSMSSPHGAGLAALHIVTNGLSPENASDIESIRQNLIDGAVKQDSDKGLVTLNDPDSNPEKIGWAGQGAPSVVWANPTDGETVAGEVTVKINASDEEDADDNLTVEWRVDGGSWRAATYDSGCDCFTDSWDTTNQSEGDHTLEARATDSDGNTTSTAVSVTVDNVDNTPSVSWNNPNDGATVSGTVSIQINASDDRDSGSDLTVEWQIDEGTWKTASYDSGCDCYTDSWDTTNDSDGDHNLDARATDTNGNTSSEARITVTVDNSGDSAPSASIEGVSERNSPNPHVTFVVDWNAGDSDADLETAELTLYDDTDGETEETVTIDISGGSASGTTELQAKHDEGSTNDYTVELVVTDGNGNTDSDTELITEDGT